ncbi:hypothetical protein K437DRAFT_255457 [Tilletiaria anomala UBC 951]|uniref:Spindle pole body component n=1 Tax=Tilletiaria anomala (strain ATCC 24038 / CBS 436.72 / UBC 951) TaxID=1037660 RepID=A0A066W8Q2_TILAU|nr:uncharacterized protein K437DRAFT_255457 [Tilletiaria anomala UBC 951]KDN48898.1 hypothetical protein K437DRAFT_255457 [Tilletiaria anomala UBC 951]
MLSEIILILAGHPSSFFEQVAEGSSTLPSSLLSSLSASVQAKEHLPLHPGERAQLEYLATLAHKCSAIKLFATSHIEHARRCALKQASLRPGTRPRKVLSKDGVLLDASGQEERSAHLAPLCARILRHLEGWDDLIVDLEDRILQRDTSLVAARSYVSLATIRVEVQVWESRLNALGRLVGMLLKGPEHSVALSIQQPGADPLELPRIAGGLSGWTGGLLIDMLTHMADTGVSRVANLMAELRDAVEDSWKILLCDWICHGTANGSPVSLGSNMISQGPDALVEQDEDGTWHLRPHSLPSSISSVTSDAILYGGRAIWRVKTHTEIGHVPAALMAAHVEMLQCPEIRPSTPHAFAKVVLEIKQDVGEWLWRNVLTDQAVISALQDLGNYFLLRSGNFALSLIEEIDDVQRQKSISARTVASGQLLESDLDLALQRASIGTELEDHPSLELLHWQKHSAHLTRLRHHHITDPNSSTPEAASSAVVFDDDLVGINARLCYAADFPLDLFLSSAELEVYTRIFSYLVAIRRTHNRVLSCWTSLSNNQRLRRRFTGTSEGGSSKEEASQRMTLLRLTWSLAKDMLWFLDTLMGHFQTDIIEVQFIRLLSQLHDVHEQHSERRQTRRSNPTIPNARGISSPMETTVRRSSSPADESSELGGSTRKAPNYTPSGFPPQSTIMPSSRSFLTTTGNTTGAKMPLTADKRLDFADLRATHVAFLLFLQEGLLLNAPRVTSLIRAILETCVRFVGHLERWGGDVLPDLLSEGSSEDASKTRESAMFKERDQAVSAIVVQLREQLRDFFEYISEGDLGVAAGNISQANQSLASMSMLGAQLPAIGHEMPKADLSRNAAQEARLQMGLAARQHLTQLSLRLDFNGFFTGTNLLTFEESAQAH